MHCLFATCTQLASHSVAVSPSFCADAVPNPSPTVYSPAIAPSLVDRQAASFKLHLEAKAACIAEWAKVEHAQGLPSFQALLEIPLHLMVPCGLPNFALNCYVNATVQAIASIPPLRRCLLASGIDVLQMGLTAQHVPVLLVLLEVMQAMFCRVTVMRAQFVVLIERLYWSVITTPVRAHALPYGREADGSEFLGFLLDDLRGEVAAAARYGMGAGSDGSAGGSAFRIGNVSSWGTPDAQGSLDELETSVLPSLYAEARGLGFITPSPLEELLSVSVSAY